MRQYNFSLVSFFQAFWGAIDDGDFVAKTNLKKPVKARYVSFNPREPQTDANGLCLRVDVNICNGGKYLNLRLRTHRKA